MKSYKARIKKYQKMKSNNSERYLKRGSIINTNIEKLIKGDFSPGRIKTSFTVVVPEGKVENKKGIVKMILGMVYFVSLVYFLTKLLT